MTAKATNQICKRTNVKINLLSIFVYVNSTAEFVALRADQTAHAHPGRVAVLKERDAVLVGDAVFSLRQNVVSRVLGVADGVALHHGP